MAYKMIQVGTGGWGQLWCKEFLPPNIKEGLIEVVAAVDINPQALRYAHKYLRLEERQCYTDVRKALGENQADFCVIAVNSSAHEEIVEQALAHDLHILSEKPIANSLEGAIRIADKVKRTGKKMGVTMSHRFDQDKTTLRQQLRCVQYGPLDYLVCRFTCNCRKFGSWGKWRHEIPDPLMFEGSIHHLDILADLAGSKCDSIYAHTWNPSWGEYAGDSQALVMMHFNNGLRAVYEGAKSNAVTLNWWGQEYIRAECRDATLILNHRRLKRFLHDNSEKHTSVRESKGQKLPLLKQAKWSNSWLIERFIHWLDSGEPMATNVQDNLQSVAMVAAAIQSSRTGQAVNVQELLSQTSDKLRLPNSQLHQH